MTRTATTRAKAEPSAVNILAIRDEVLDYLAGHSIGRQGTIADAVGLRRETICSYAQKRGALTDVGTLQRLYDWMLTDKKTNGRS